jgi:alkaline phosphatase
LRRWIDQAHDQGRKVRFWATPETETFWRTAYQAGLDFLNTDQLLAMRQVLLSLPSP